MAKQYRHKVIRLPPCYCHFNFIDLIWPQIKGHVARNNKKFNITEITKLTAEAIEQVMESNWKKVVNHTCTVISESWEDEGILEKAIEMMTFSLNSSSDSSVFIKQ